MAEQYWGTRRGPSRPSRGLPGPATTTGVS